LIVVVGFSLVGWWAINRYGPGKSVRPELFRVGRGDLIETVKVRGEVAAKKEFDLEFPFSGRVEQILVGEGDKVEAGDPLLKLETTELALSRRGLEADLSGQEAALEKLVVGPTEEERQVYRAKVASAEASLADSKQNLVDKINDAFTKGDDAVRNRADQFFDYRRTGDPRFRYIILNTSLAEELERERAALEPVLTTWKAVVDQARPNDFSSALSLSVTNLARIRSFLDRLVLAINDLIPTINLTQTILDSYRTDIATARANIDVAASGLTSAKEKERAANSALEVAEGELALEEAGARIEDVNLAQAKIDAARAKLTEVDEKIRKSTIFSPAEGEVLKIWLEKGETFTPGSPAVSVYSPDYKVSADVSELEIGRIKEGDEVSVKLDAFPADVFTGRVAVIDPMEVIKEGDKYYKVNVFFENGGQMIRPGMSADLIVLISKKSNVLRVPELAVSKDIDGSSVLVWKKGRSENRPVAVGVSDGEYVEVISGLEEGEEVVIAAD
jgi:RND family efflux transporter MFP subunit